jgi:hypothetical protein
MFYVVGSDGEGAMVLGESSENVKTPSKVTRRLVNFGASGKVFWTTSAFGVQWCAALEISVVHPITGTEITFENTHHAAYKPSSPLMQTL